MGLIGYAFLAIVILVVIILVIHFNSPEDKGKRQVLKNIWERNPDVLTTEQIEYIYNTLVPLVSSDDAIKQKHISDIQDRFDSMTVCPVCGGKLILRTVQKGPYLGNQFYGCSNYPKCKYIKNL